MGKKKGKGQTKPADGDSQPPPHQVGPGGDNQQSVAQPGPSARPQQQPIEHFQHQQGRGGGRGGGSRGRGSHQGQGDGRTLSPQQEHQPQQQGRGGGRGWGHQGRGDGRMQQLPQFQQQPQQQAQQYQQRGGGRGRGRGDHQGQGDGRAQQQGRGGGRGGGRSWGQQGQGAPPQQQQPQFPQQQPPQQFSQPLQQFQQPPQQFQYPSQQFQQSPQQFQQRPQQGRGAHPGLISPTESLSISSQSTSPSIASTPSPALPKPPPTLPPSPSKDVALTTFPPGTKGRPIPIEVNMLRMDLSKMTPQAVHYDVTITPDTPKGLMYPVMQQFARENYPNRSPAFDGRKNLYSPTMLPFGDSIIGSVKVQGENREKEFKVEIKFAANIDLTPLTMMMKDFKTSKEYNITVALNCLDVVLHTAAHKSTIKVGRSFFTPPQGRFVDLGQGMEMYHGFFQSVIRGWTSFLNVDVAHKAFPKGMHVLDLICDLLSDFRNKWQRNDLNRGLGNRDIETVKKFVSKIKVQFELPNKPSSKRIYKVVGLGDSARAATFRLETGQTQTVLQYFEQTKQVRLQYPDLPTLWVGSKQKKTLIPCEFCTVLKGQAIQGKMTEMQTSAMIKEAATSTNVRKDKIYSSLSQVRHNQDQCVREFGLNIANQFTELKARVLDPPVLKYKDARSVTPSKGVWRNDRAQFLIPSRIQKWGIICVARYAPRNMGDISASFVQAAKQLGMEMPPAERWEQVPARMNDLKQYFQSKKGYDFIFVVVPQSGPEYGMVKAASETYAGCLTQCIKDRTLNRFNNQIVGNLLLKINSKLDGTNHCLGLSPPILSRPCMIMGADVTHPSPDAQNTPSVAAVTASHDRNAFCYNICWRLQPPKVEIIQDLKAIVKTQLMYFFTRNKGMKPERIVFFRDGVSEGQFEQVKLAEIQAIQQACKEVQKEDYEPRITFLVVQKRHHTRLFPKNPRDSEDKNNNVPAGTCVDTEIVSPVMQNFYLVSHASIQGVAKPTKYVTLHDDNKMSADDIQALTYHLCHMFTRCNRSVSYPAPTYYAHLAAARGKVYIDNERFLDMDKLQEYQKRYEITQKILTQNPMFFV